MSQKIKKNRNDDDKVDGDDVVVKKSEVVDFIQFLSGWKRS